MNIDRMAQLAAADVRAQEDKLDRALLASAIDKVARKYERLNHYFKALPDETIMMKLTIGELRALKQFHSKMHDS